MTKPTSYPRVVGTIGSGENKITLVDSGRFQPGPPVPYPVTQKIGPAPAKTPFQVIFTTCGTREEEIVETHDARMYKRAHLVALQRVRLHFCGRTFWIHNDGSLRPKAPFLSHARWFGGETVELLIDFGDFYTELSGRHLPRAITPIEKLDIGFPCDPWRLNITRKEDQDWRDRIVFSEGSFYLLSVLQAFENRKA